MEILNVSERCSNCVKLEQEMDRVHEENIQFRAERDHLVAVAADAEAKLARVVNLLLHVQILKDPWPSIKAALAAAKEE